MADILTVSRDLFNEMNKKDVLYCHWKSNEHLYEGLIGETDLDVLVHPNHKALARKTLSEAGYICLVTQYGSHYPEVEDWISCDYKTGKLVHIHLHFRMVTGHKGMKEYSLPWAEEVLQKRVLDSDYGVYVCPPNYEIVILFTRIGLKATFGKVLKAKLGKYTFKENDLQEIIYLRERVEYDKVKQIVNVHYGKDADKLINIIKKEKLNSSDMALLIKIVSRHMNQFNAIHGIKYYFLRTWYPVVLPLRRFARNRFSLPLITRKTLGKDRGITVAFMGQDGAGKTTVTNEVKKWISWKMDVRKNYLGNGENYLSWRKKLAVFLKPIKGAPIRFIRGVLIIGDLKKLAKHTYKSICSANRYAESGGIAIFDRYPQVQFLGINDGPKIRQTYLPMIRYPIMKQYVELCARTEEKYLNMASEISPDSVIKLILDPAVSIQRKPQESFENVQKKHGIIKSIQFPNSDVLVVDANQNYEEEIKLIHNHIWNLIIAKQTKV